MVVLKMDSVRWVGDEMGWSFCAANSESGTGFCLARGTSASEPLLRYFFDSASASERLLLNWIGLFLAMVYANFSFEG